jgi:hypothetical protein
MRIPWATTVFAAFVFAACQRDIAKPPAAPASNDSRPFLFIPADLELVLRLDVRRYRETMGPEPEQSLAKLWQSFGLDSQGTSRQFDWLVPVLKSTDTLWLGCRPGPVGCRDFVFVMRGRFARSSNSFGFGPSKDKRDLGAGWLSYELESEQRTSASRLYWRAPELVILVSSAELDSAERSIEQSVDRTKLEPSENGLVSLIVQSKALAQSIRDRSPQAARWLEQSERVEIHFDSSERGTRVTFSVKFRDAPQADRAAQALRILILALSRFDPRLRTGDLEVQLLNSEVLLRVSFPSAMESGLSSPGEVAPQER